MLTRQPSAEQEEGLHQTPNMLAPDLGLPSFQNHEKVNFLKSLQTMQKFAKLPSLDRLLWQAELRLSSSLIL